MTYRQLDFAIKGKNSNGRYSLSYKGSVTLQAGEFNKSEQGSWYVMAIVGGTVEDLNTTAPKVRFLPTMTQQVSKDKIDLEVPYISPWMPLNIERDTYGSQLAMHFKRQGAIIRYTVRNGMINPYKVKALYVATNTFDTQGRG